MRGSTTRLSERPGDPPHNLRGRLVGQGEDGFVRNGLGNGDGENPSKPPGHNFVPPLPDTSKPGRAGSAH